MFLISILHKFSYQFNNFKAKFFLHTFVCRNSFSKSYPYTIKCVFIIFLKFCSRIYENFSSFKSGNFCSFYNFYFVTHGISPLAICLYGDILNDLKFYYKRLRNDTFLFDTGIFPWQLMVDLA